MKSLPKKQSGAVLMVALLLLLVVAILATTTSETNILQLQMAGNDQAKAESLQHAFAIVDAILDNRSNTAVIGDVGYNLCSPDSATHIPGVTCDEQLVNIASTLLDPEADVGYYVQRVGPALTSTPYLDEDDASSASSFSVARQEVVVSYDRSDERLGKVEIVQGLLRLVPKLGQ